MTLKVNIRYYFGQYNIGQSFFIKSLKFTRFHNVNTIQRNKLYQAYSGKRVVFIAFNTHE